MNLFGKKLTALLLAVCLLLGLAACGDKDNSKGGGSQTLSGTIYVPTFADITSDADYIYQGCADGESFYFLGNVRGEEHEETSTWYDEKGEEQTETYTYYDYRNALFRAPLEGGAAVELENFQMSVLPEGADGDVGINSLWVDAEGNLWVTEYMYIYTFDLPDDFDEENDNKWNYDMTEENRTILRKLDSTGTELDSIDLSGLAEKAEMGYTYNTVVDNNGNIYTSDGDSKIAVLDKDMNLLFSIEGQNLWGTMTLLGDGSVGMSNYYSDEEASTSGYRMQVIDLAAQGWGDSYEMSRSSYEVYPGGGDYLFYYLNGTSIYGRKAGSAEGEKVFSWIGADIDENYVQFFTFLPDGRVAAIMRDWSGDTVKYESAILTPTDASTLPPKTVLTYACMGLNYDIRNKIIEFNKASSDYRIEVTDYSEFNTGEDTSAGLTKMNTEILAGRVPDILDAGGNMPVSQYGAKGLLEDLWPFIEGDTEIGGREGVMENVLKAAEQDGKLYRVFSMFDIRTVVGASQVVGDRTTWTLADLKAALATMPEGCSIFGVSDTKENMLSTILACNLDSFVDWTTGKCQFNGDSFKSLLEFCNSFPAEFNWDDVNWDEWENEDQRVMAGKQMLQSCYIDSFTGLQYYTAIFGGSVSFVGYPMEDGSVGSSFQIMNNGLAMSSTCKDKEGAWSFIRQQLLPQYSEQEDGSSYNIYDFPVNKQDFDKYMNDAMTVEYMTSDDGEPILDAETGEPIKVSKRSYYISSASSAFNIGMEDDSQWIEVYAATQEEVDQIMDLYNSITTIWNYDTSIFDIIQENAGAYFAGDRTVDDTANLIQSAVELYIGEQR